MRRSEAKATQAVWKERVRAWRASGASAAQFVRGKEFTASGLLYWSKRVEPEARTSFVRVVPTRCLGRHLDLQVFGRDR
jgi:hypothetical protein